MKKVLYILPDLYSTGGISRYNREFIKVLSKEKNIFLKIISRNDKNLKTYKNFSVYSFGNIKNLFLRKILFSLKIFSQALFFKPDLIICAHINFSPICYLLNKTFKRRYIIIVHGIEVWNLKSNFKEMGLKKALKIISVSNFTRNKCLEDKLCKEDQIVIVPNSVNKSRYFPKEKNQKILEKLNIAANEKIILTVARLSRSEAYKGYDRVIEALPLVIKEIPNIKYLLVGKGDDLARIKSLIKNKNLEDRVILAGFVDDKDLVDYYNLADVFVMPSKKEGFGIVFLEALASGVPVIAGNQDGSVDAVLNGKLGVLVNPDSIQEIATAIINVLKGNIENKKLLDRNYLRQEVIKNYGKEEFEKKVKNLINKII